MATNITPISPATLPYTYTANYGQAYSLASVSAQGCVDTVYPLTANAGGVFNVKGVPLTATQALTIISDANSQFGPLFNACQSLLNQVSATTSVASVTNWDFFPLTGNVIFDDMVGLVAIVIGFGIIVKIAEWIGLMKPRR